jgi:hypothetical protein
MNLAHKTIPVESENPKPLSERKYGGKIVLVIPSYASTVLGQNLPALTKLHDLGVALSCVGGQSLICRLRSWIATQFSEQFEQIVWVDSDIIFTAEDVIELIEEPGEIVSGLYPKRAMDQGWACTPVEDANFESSLDRTPPPDRVGLKGYVHECAGVGFGFVRTSSAIFPRIAEVNQLLKSPDGVTPFFLPALNMEGKYIGEDYAFCMRALAAGYRVWVRGDIIVTHRGEMDFTAETAGAPNPFCSHAWRASKCVYCGWQPPPAMGFS